MKARGFFPPDKADDAGGLMPGKKENAAWRKKDRTGAARSYERGLLMEDAKTPSIQWFPGHMAKTRRIMRESMKLVDIVIELRDARLPYSSGNPEIRKLVGGKPRIIVLNKSDMADSSETQKWISHFEKQGAPALAADCRSGKGLNGLAPLVRETLAPLIERRNARGLTGRPLRMMVAGIPNSGKSSLINRLAKAKRTKVEDRPGVTRDMQWVKTGGGFELLDMPGVLWPKFDDNTVAENLAFTGAIKDNIMDIEALAARFLMRINKDYGELLSTRYKLDGEETENLGGYDLLRMIGGKRGMLLPGGEINMERAAIAVLDEFRAGALGRITLERIQI